MRPCHVVELRRYTLHAGRRDELIDLFDTHLIEAQEELGMHVIGQFRDVDRPDQFVWFRGYPDMAARSAGLTGFYLDGEVWATHAAAANATMIDSDDVLLLRPVPGAQDLCAAAGDRDASGVRGAYLCTAHHLGSDADAAVGHWLRAMHPALLTAGVQIAGVLRSEHAVNDFPRLPVRADAEVLVVVERHDSLTAAALSMRRRGDRPEFAEADAGLRELERAERQTAILQPTSRSALR